MSQALSLGGIAVSSAVPRAWRSGLLAAATWFAAAVLTAAVPDVIVWGATGLLALLLAAGAAVLLGLSFTVHRLGRVGDRLVHYGPWFVAIGIWIAVWEVLTAKLGWLPKPFFAPPQGLLQVYVTDWYRLLVCIAYTGRLWILGFGSGVVVGFVVGVMLGWSRSFNYWGMPILKLIGPVPASAWIPATFFLFPTTFHASVFLVALASGVPVAILTASGVASVGRSFYDVARTLGANERFQVLKVAIPASLPHVFVGVFMGTYYSFAVLVVAEMLGAKYGLGWYLQFNTAYSAYTNVYAALLVMAVLCCGIVRLSFVARERLLSWQKGLVAW